MTWLNWTLALVSAVVWIGPLLWYFWEPISNYWVRRHDKWFRQD